MYGGNASTWENMIIGGWQITGTTNYSAGLPFTPTLRRVRFGQRRRCLLPVERQLVSVVHGREFI